MRKLAGIAVSAAVVTAAIATPTTASVLAPNERFELHVKTYHRPGAPVIIVLQNVTDEPQRFDTPWSIENAKTEVAVASFHWSRNERRLAPGETAIWEWDQRDGSYTTEPAPPGEGRKAPPGGYRIRIDTGDGEIKRRFHIGRFFTLGFEGRPAKSFTVFVNEAKPIKLMKAEAKAADKTLIVSGKIRDVRRYNDDWSYSMGPGSIVLGEVFIEVCDGSPGYVERHKDEWLGERWCPWSSHVARAGR